jgi:hypothetical protein
VKPTALLAIVILVPLGFVLWTWQDDPRPGLEAELNSIPIPDDFHLVSVTGIDHVGFPFNSPARASYRFASERNGEQSCDMMVRVFQAWTEEWRTPAFAGLGGSDIDRPCGRWFASDHLTAEMTVIGNLPAGYGGTYWNQPHPDIEVSSVVVIEVTGR